MDETIYVILKVLFDFALVRSVGQYMIQIHQLD